MRGRDPARLEHIVITELGAERVAVGYRTAAVPRNDRTELVATRIDEDAGFSHAAGGEALYGSVGFRRFGKPREHFRNGLPKLLWAILRESGLRDMCRRRFGGLGQYPPFEIDGDGPNSARAEIEAREQWCAAQSLAPYGAEGQATHNVALGNERDDDRRNDRGHGSDTHEPELDTARIDGACNVNGHGNRLAAAN